MSEPAIPDAAVKAAAQTLWNREGGGPDPIPSYFLDDARLALAAARPFMAGEEDLIMAQAGKSNEPKTRDEALKEAELLSSERHREGYSDKWLYDAIERLHFFNENEIWELLESLS